MAFDILRGRGEGMGLVKTRRLAAMQKQQRVKAVAKVSTRMHWHGAKGSLCVRGASLSGVRGPRTSCQFCSVSH